ncbi:hypothetical protein D3C71_2146460 [compost metagenome]
MKRCGKQKAVIAVAHLLLRIIYVVLRDKVPYRELGAEYFGTHEVTAEFWIKKLEQLGYKVDLTPVT